MSITRGADNLVRVLGPTKKSDGTALDNSNESATSVFRLFYEHKEHSTVEAKTRLRTAIVASGAIWEIPHIVPLWLEAGDTLSILTDAGELHETTIVSIAVGTDKDTESTNFDTLTMTAGPSTGCEIGAPITLKIKATTALILPAEAKNQEFESGDTLEFHTDTAVLDVLTLSTVRTTQSSEGGETAPDQSEYKVLTVAGGTTAPITTNALRRIRCKLGADISMSEFPTGGAGTPPVDATWVLSGGFSGSIEDTKLGLEIGDLMRVEVHFNGGAGLQSIVSTLEPVVEG